MSTVASRPEGLLEAYALGRVLGRGGTGEVRAAVHRSTGLLVALKRVRVGAAREARTIAMLDHPNVVRIYDTGTDAEGGWIAMERAAGAVGPPAHVDELVAILDAVLAGLAAAHAAGVQHGDVKPGNVLVRDDGSVVLADFGLVAGSGGTPAYLAPEVFDGRLCGPASDLYAVGCLGAALLTGAPPFGMGDWDALADAHRSRPVPELHPRFAVPLPLVTWLRTLLRKDARDRYQHAADARYGLAELAGTRVAVAVRGGIPAADRTVTRVQGAAVPCAPAAPIGAPRPARLPATWPEGAAPRQPGEAGTGLLGLLAVPFVGRLAERAALWSHLLDVERSRRPLVVRLDGPPGSGRSRLAAALGQAAGEAGCAVPGAEAGRVRVLWRPEGPTEVEGGVLQLTAAGPADAALALPPFDRATCRRVLARWVHLQRDQVADIADRCSGNLGLAVATVTHAVGCGLLEPGPRGLVARGPVPLAPDRVEAQRERLRDLPAELRPALQAAAVLDDPVETDRLSAMGVSAQPLVDWLVAEQLAVAVDGGFQWVSAALREAALPDAREALHRAAAETYCGTGSWDRWRRGVHLLAAGFLDAALEPLFSASVDVTGSGKMVQVARVLSDVERALFAEGRPESDRAWAQLYRRKAQLGPTHLGFAACRAHNERAIELARAHGWQEVELGALGTLCWLLDIMCLPAVAEPLIERLLQIQPVAPSVFTDLGNCRLSQGRPAEALAAFEEGMRRAGAAGQPYNVLICQACVGVAKRHLGHADTLEHFARATEALHAEGFHSADADLACAIADTHRFEGDLDLAIAEYRRAVHLSAQGESRADLSFELGLALALGEGGQLEAARARLAACRDQLRDEGPTWEALLSLHTAVVEAELGAGVSVDELERIGAALDAAGFADPDVARAAGRLLRASSDPGVVRWAEARLTPRSGPPTPAPPAPSR